MKLIQTKKFGLVLTLMVMLSTLASAGQVNEKMGPYNVKFSLPIDVMINKSVGYGETYSGTGYSIYDLELYNTTNNFLVGMVQISDFNNSMSTDLNPVSAALQASQKELGYTQTSDYSRTIDGRPGILVVGDGAPIIPTIPTRFIEWEYFLDAHTTVLGMTRLPWDEGALQLLKTIHVEKLNTTK